MIKKTIFFCFLVCIANISLLHSQTSLNEIISFPQNFVGRSFSFNNVKISSRVSKVTVKEKTFYSIYGICKDQNFGSIYGDTTFITSERIAKDIVRRASKSSDWLNYTRPCKISFKIYRIDSFWSGKKYYALVTNIDF